MTLDYGVATFVTPGNRHSGDLEVVRNHSGGAVLAVIDGIGHGEEAAAAARIARDVIASDPRGSPDALIMRCHDALHLTRGAVLSIASIDFSRLQLRWLGVGNVRALLQHAEAGISPAREELLLRGGVVGAPELPALQTSVIPFRPGDTLIFATDGIRPQFADTLVVSGPPQALADEILAANCLGNDDALVLVARPR